MNKKKQLIIAIVIGVAALLLNKVYIDQNIKDQIKSQNKIQIVRAKQRLQKGVPLRRNMVEAKWVPESYAPMARIRWEQLSQYEGLDLNTDVIQGDYVLQNYFKTDVSTAASLSAQVSGQNFRAISLPVDETNSLAGSIVSGDRIDIVFTFSNPYSHQFVSSVLLQNVPVLSTGSYVLNEVGDRVGAQRYNTLTLRLSAQDALKLNYARQQGKISILLRNPKDDSLINIPAIGSVEDLLTTEEKERIKTVPTGPLSGNYDENFKEQIKTLMEGQRKQQGQVK